MSAVLQSDASPAPERACRNCGRGFHPRKSWQAFCGSQCRTAWHENDDGGVRAIVARVSVLKRGGVAVTLRFETDERSHALALTPGDVLEIVKQ